MKYLNCLLFFVCIFTSCNNNVLLDEYKLLYTDIKNINTCGYKSYFDYEKSMATININSSQGSLTFTESDYDCAILGQGFYKVKLDGGYGYTRNGNLMVNEYGELMILWRYSFYESIYFPEYFIFGTMKISENGDILVSVQKPREELEEVYVGQLKIYEIPTNLLEHYQDGIYKLKTETNEEKIITDGRILHKFVENSNVYILACFLRMYYILSNLDEKRIPNIEFKKSILKMLIESKMEGNSHIETFIPFLNHDY